MIIVTGTKRSGTSMWMQILIGAGFPAFGEAFPGQWKNTIGQANPDGFYESMLRTGIYYRTNPHPQTGAYFFPEQVERHVVKVFIPGLARSDRAYIGKVVATLRPWREYEASLNRLWAMEDDKRPEHVKGPVRMPPVLEWWAENFTLFRDIAIRRYPVHVQTYDGLLADPRKVIGDTISWIGEGDLEGAVAAVRPSNRTQKKPESTSIEPEIAAVFDELYAIVGAEGGLTGSFIKKLNEINEKLAPRVRQAQRLVAEDTQRRRQRRAGRPPEGQPLAPGTAPVPDEAMDDEE